MKEFFIAKEFGSEAQSLLDHALAILEKYSGQGYDLSLRQLYYQLVAADLLPQKWADKQTKSTNNERSYKNLGNLISDARLAGLIDWAMIDDRGRTVESNPHWENPRQFMESVTPQFTINKWEDQPCYVEVMVEKDALSGVLEPVCSELDIPFSANKGYSSSSAMYKAGKRLEEKLQDKRDVHVIYLGDHDPSGIDMTRDIEERLRMFSHFEDYKFGLEFKVHRIALNMDQIRELRPPRNPAKITDSRAADYISKFGRNSWELDAIEPSALARLVTLTVERLRDDQRWNAAVAREKAMRDELIALAKKSKFK